MGAGTMPEQLDRQEAGLTDHFIMHASNCKKGLVALTAELLPWLHGLLW